MLACNVGPKTIPTPVPSTTICQAVRMNHDNRRSSTGLSVSRGTAQCSAPRKALARKPYAITLVCTIRQRPGENNSKPFSGFQ